MIVRVPGHPRGGKNRYVFEHILVAEDMLGRSLRAKRCTIAMVCATTIDPKISNSGFDLSRQVSG